jgi:predicted aspartyl protease
MKSTQALSTTALLDLTHRNRNGALGTAASTRNTQPESQIPFTFDPLLQPKIIVQVRINGRAPLPFWVDTGLNAGVIIDTRAAAQLGLKPIPHAREISLGPIKAWPCGLNSASFVGADATDIIPISGIRSALVGDLTVFRPSLNREPIAGMIGILALCEHAVNFDFSSRLITLCHETGLRFSSARYAIPMNQRPGDGRYFVTVTLQRGIATELLLDTGAEGTSISASVAQRLCPLAVKSVGMGTAYGRSITPMLLLPSIRIGDCEIAPAAVTSMPQTPVGFPLGIDLLSRFHMTMDFPNRRLLLDRPAGTDVQVPLDGYTGIHLATENNRETVGAPGPLQTDNASSQHPCGWLVDSIDTDSPAHHAGVKVGDRIQGVDGRSLAGIPFLTARRLLNGHGQTDVKLTLLRVDGKRHTATFSRANEFVRSGLPIDGLFLHLCAHRPMEIVGLLQGCPGEQAGLRQGDIVLEFNGHPTSEISSEVLAVEFRKPLLRMKVLRQGSAVPMTITLATPSGKAQSAERAIGNTGMEERD